MDSKISQTKRVFVFLFALVGILTGVNPNQTRAEERPRPPNIVLILADDLGWADLACYGSNLHETPNLDRLAGQGVRFTDAYSASPVCTPTRVSILTGKHPARLQMTIWREAAHDRGNEALLEPVCVDSLPADETTVAELLQEAGYYNVHLGKWHVGRAEGYPQVHGFHRNIGGTLWGAPQSFWHPFHGDGYFKDWRYVPDLEPSSEGDYLTDLLTNRAMDCMDELSDAQQPFFLNLWYHTVHTPIEGKPGLVAHYQQKINSHHLQKNAHYAAMVHSLDENVGRLLAKIDDLGIGPNTWVFFASDNGGFVNRCKLHKDLQVANNRPLRSGKGSCYEGGIRIPLIVRGPGVFPGGVCRTPVYSCDLFPTLLDAAGVTARPHGPIDGLALSRLLEAPRSVLGRDAIYFHYPHYYQTTTPVSAIRKGNWKLLDYYEGSRLELYDLSTDLGEATNQARPKARIAERLKSELNEWRLRVGALHPEANQR